MWMEEVNANNKGENKLENKQAKVELAQQFISDFNKFNTSTNRRRPKAKFT
jgi:hypothetical protein